MFVGVDSFKARPYKAFVEMLIVVEGMVFKLQWLRCSWEMSQFPPGKSWSLFSTPLRWSQSNEEDSNMILVMHMMVTMKQVSHKTQYVIKKAGGNVTLDCTDFTGEQEAAWRKIGGVVTLCLIICSRVIVCIIPQSCICRFSFCVRDMLLWMRLRNTASKNCFHWHSTYYCQ